MGRVDAEMRGAVDLLVWSRIVVGAPVGDWLPFADFKSRHRHGNLPLIVSLSVTVLDDMPSLAPPSDRAGPLSLFAGIQTGSPSQFKGHRFSRCPRSFGLGHCRSIRERSARQASAIVEQFVL
jgi:hypothetical protein